MKRYNKGLVKLITIFIISLFLACSSAVPPQYLGSDDSYDCPIVYASEWEKTDKKDVMLREFLIFDSDSNVCIISSSKSKRYVLNNYEELCNNNTTIWHQDNGYPNHYYFEILSKSNITYKYVFTVDSKSTALVLIEVIDEEGKVLCSLDRVYKLIHLTKTNQK